MKTNWLVKKLGEVAEVTSSKRVFKKEYVSEGIPFYRTKEIAELSQSKNISLDLYISGKQFNEIGNQFGTPNKGDILISAVGTIGISWIIPDDRKFYFKDGNLLWIKNFRGINSYYLKFFLDYSFNSVSKLAAGGAYKALTIINLKKFQVLVPNISTQQKIVERLDAIRKAQELCDQQIQKTEELFESLLVKELSNLDKSQIKKLNDLCIKITDGAHKTPTYISTGIPFLSVKNMINGVVDFTECKFISNTEHNQLTKRCSPEFEDILIAKSGTTGVATLVNIKKQFSLFVSVALLKPNRDLIQSKFLVYFLNSESGKRQMAVRTKGGIVKNLHIEEIRELEVPVPSQENQQEIIEKLEAVQNYKKLLLKQKELLKELFDSVLDKSMKGEMDN